MEEWIIIKPKADKRHLEKPNDERKKSIAPIADKTLLAVDILNLQLCMLESKIFRDIDPIPTLTVREFAGAVGELKKIKKKVIPRIISAVIKQNCEK
ncbi:GH17047 [Drosophila grimshawi]|uniref:GH17047 n=1 Tax=Drosophila grimshawi TaxID=7222 RepID=B4IZJ2_DROGR|nr:GH17047 [Drosophila grimshawi]